MKDYVAKRIILTEDDGDDVAIFNEVLTDIEANLQMTVADDGAMLIEILTGLTLLPDLIFLDINMPRKNGFQCLKEIRNHYKWKDIKVIMLSTSTDQYVIDLAYRYGADVYVAKSSSYSQFTEKIAKCLQFDWNSIASEHDD